MSLISYALGLMLSLPAYHQDAETFQEREERLTVLAHALEDVAAEATCHGSYAVEGCVRLWPGTRKQLVALEVAQAYSESRLALRIHEDRCRDNECDPLRYWDPERKAYRVHHRAKSLFQVQRQGDVTLAEWRSMGGTSYEATRASAWAAARVLSRGYRACGSTQGAISLYATGKTCRWKGAPKRERLYRELLSRTPAELERRVEKRREEVTLRQQRLAARAEEVVES